MEGVVGVSEEREWKVREDQIGPNMIGRLG